MIEHPTCDGCGELKKKVDESVMSAFSGYLCTNEDCPYD